MLSPINRSSLPIVNERGISVGDYPRLSSETDDTGRFSRAISALSNGGVIVVPPNANAYVVNMPNLPATVQNIDFVGTKGSTIQFSALLSNTAPQVVFTNVGFRGLKFTTTSNPTGGCAFTLNSSHLTFVDCTIQDFAQQFCMYATSDVRFKNCKWRSSNGITYMNGMIGNVGKDFWVEDCDFNYAPNNAGGANAVIALNWTAGLSGNIWIVNNKFFDQNQTGYFCDTAIDMEPGGTSQLENVHIESNVIYNAKTFISAAKNIFVVNNVFRTTSVLSGNTANDNMLDVKTTNSTIACGFIVIEGNDFIEDDGAYNYQAQPINIEPSGTIDTVMVKNNHIQVNGKATAHTMSNPWVAIAVNTDVNNASQIDKVIIEGNVISYTSAPSTLPNAITVSANLSAIDYVSVRNNKLACNGNCCAAFAGFSLAFALSLLVMEGNDVTEAGTFGSGFATGYNIPGKISIQNNYGYNPVGNFTSPAVPTSGTAYTNNFGYPCRVFVTGGTVTSIAINSVSTLMTSGSFVLYPRETIIITYSAIPSWQWFGL